MKRKRISVEVDAFNAAATEPGFECERGYTMVRRERAVMSIAWSVMLLLFVLQAAPSSAPAGAQAAPSAAGAALDFEFFKTRVQPIFLEKRPGFTRCVVCHSGEGNNSFLRPLAAGATTWDDEQSRLNFQRVSRLVVPGQPMKSRLLLHPLEPKAGGDEFHNGGRQFSSQDDPQFKTLAAWVGGQTVGGAGSR
jgi:hypothetical protein